MVWNEHVGTLIPAGVHNWLVTPVSCTYHLHIVLFFISRGHSINICHLTSISSPLLHCHMWLMQQPAFLDKDKSKITLKSRGLLLSRSKKWLPGLDRRGDEWNVKCVRKEVENWGDSKDEMLKGGETARGEGWQQPTNFPGTLPILAFQCVRGKWGLGQPCPAVNNATEGPRAYVSLKPPLPLICTGSSIWHFCFLFCFWLLWETSTPDTVPCGTSINPPYSSANFQIGHDGR